MATTSPGDMTKESCMVGSKGTPSNRVTKGRKGQHGGISSVHRRHSNTSVVINKVVFAALCMVIVVTARVVIMCVYVHREWNLAVLTQHQHDQEEGHRLRNVHPFPIPRRSKSEMIRSLQSTTACEPVQRIVFIKTHKTGSTTLASILERFGYLRNLSFALGRSNHILSNERLFNRWMPYHVPRRNRFDFDMLVNHVRYNRKEMNVVIIRAKYISIIRDPATQLESAFGYFEMAKSLNITTDNPFETFMSDPRKYYAMKGNRWTRARNCMIYDLGFDHSDDENVTKVQEKIDTLSKEIDLMLITEYFDESLIVLRKLLCWEYKDILYISKGIRSESHRHVVSDATAERVRAWSSADLALYEHFNSTLWKKVRDYGPAFQQDLDNFRSMLQEVKGTCVSQRKSDTGDRRVDRLSVKTDSKYCEDLIRGDVPYTTLIRESMIARAAQEADMLED